MGKVFSVEEIANHQVPQPGVHEEAAHFILHTLFGEEADDISARTDPPYLGLEAGLVFGSVALGTADRRSDLDMILVYDPRHSSQVLEAIGRVGMDTERTYHVVAGVEAMHTDSLQDPMQRRVDTIFEWHLHNARDVVSKYRPGLMRNRFPLPKLEHGLHGPEVAEYAMSYFFGKTRAFARTFGNRGDEDNLKTIQKALEMPSAAARRALAAVWNPDTDGPYPQNEEKRFVLRLLMAKLEEIDSPNAPTGRLRTLMPTLFDINQEYNSVLEGAIEGNLTLGNYGAWLESHSLHLRQMAHDVAFDWGVVMRSVVLQKKDDPAMTLHGL